MPEPMPEPEVTPAVNALVTWEYAQNYLGLDADDEVTVLHLINAASDMAERHVGRALKSREHTQVYSASGRQELLLREWPVTLIESVHLDPTGEFGPETAITDTRFDPDLGILFRKSGFPQGWQNVRVAYTAGYDPVPEDLQAATCEVVLWLMKRVRAGQIGIKSISGDGVNTDYELTMPTNAMRIFETYRRAYADG